jgi:hypothetical protein
MRGPQERGVWAINTNVKAQFDIMMFEYIAVVLKHISRMF